MPTASRSRRTPRPRPAVVVRSFQNFLEARDATLRAKLRATTNTSHRMLLKTEWAELRVIRAKFTDLLDGGKTSHAK